MKLDLTTRELGLKIIYHGPPMSGKTTNLKELSERLPSTSVGRLVKLDTRDHRTLFLDLLPVGFHTANRFRVRLQLVSVPGQPMHEAMRRVLLDDVDGVVFVADSQVKETLANNRAFREMQESLAHEVPLVIQFNKQDMPAVRGASDLDALARTRKVLVVPAVALQGVGVVETLTRILTLVWRRLAPVHGLETLLEMDEGAFIDRLVGRV